MENIISQPQTLNLLISENAEPLSVKQAIVSMVKAMQADYGRTFQTQFHDETVLQDYKNRLLTKLRDLPIGAIIAGYEKAAEANPKFCPTVSEIVASVLQVVKQAKKEEKNRLEAERVAALPPPKTIQCNPVAMLKDAMQRIAGEEAGMSKTEKLARHHARLKDHEALMAAHVATIRLDAQDHLCSASFCDNPGTLSHATTGSSNFYCNEHFRRAG